MPEMNDQHTGSGRFSYDGLNRVIHEKARLGILTSLATHPDGLLFPDLKELCDLTDGNLNRHLQVLRDAQLIESWKRGEGRKSQTLVRLTSDGRRQFLAYLQVLESVVADAADAVAEPVANRSLRRDGWSPA
jgi:DNA-binding transcriptional ArsR family regulator